MKRSALYLLLGVVVVGGVAAGAYVLRPWEAAQQQESETRTAVVERGTLLVVVSASGSVEPETSVGLSFEVPGRADEVAVEVGDNVQAGDFLAHVEDAQLKLQVRQAQDSLKLVEAQLAQLNAGPRPPEIAAAEANLRVAEAQLAAAEANRDQLASGVSRAQIAAAEAQIANAELQRKPVQDAHDRVVHGGGSSDEAKEQASSDLYVANKVVEAAQVQLRDLLAGADPNDVRASEASVLASSAQVGAAQAQLDLLRSGVTDEQVADVEAQVTQARVALELAENALESAAMLAPFDAIVAEVTVQVGDIASPGIPQIVLLDASSLHVTVAVDEIDVGQLMLGQVVDVMVDALPGAVIKGTIERISPIATFEGGVVYYGVDVMLAPTNELIRIDMSATATIVVEELVDVLLVPTWVVRVDRATGQTYVHRQKGDTVERVDVDLGMRHEGVAQVLSGVSEGDTLIWVDEALPFGLGGS